MTNRLFLFFSLFICFISTQIWACPEVFIVGISGGTGSGKTYIADKIKKTLGDEIIVLTEDAYYRDLSHLTKEKRAKVNFDHPESIEFTLLKKHLLSLKRYESIEVPQYDFSTHTRVPSVKKIKPKAIVLVEGILLLAVPEIRDLFNLKVYVNTDDDIRFLRRVVRDISERGRTVDSVCGQYLETVYPMFQKFVKPSKRFADVVISGSDDNSSAIDLLISKLKTATTAVIARSDTLEKTCEAL